MGLRRRCDRRRRPRLAGLYADDSPVHESPMGCYGSSARVVSGNDWTKPLSAPRTVRPAGASWVSARARAETPADGWMAATRAGRIDRVCSAALRRGWLPLR